MRARKYICILPSTIYLLGRGGGMQKSERSQSYVRVTSELPWSPSPLRQAQITHQSDLPRGGHYCLIQNHKVIIWLYGCGQQMGCYAFSKYKFARQTATS